MSQTRLVLWLPVAMGTGVLLYFALRTEPPFWAGAAVAGPALLAAFAPLGRARGALALLAAGGIGFAAAQVGTARALPLEPLPRRAVVVTGTVRALDLLPTGRRVTLGRLRFGPTAGAPATGPPRRGRRIRLRLRDSDPAPVAVGDRIRVRALVRPPSPPAYPGGWDLQRGAFFADLAGYGFAIGPVARLAHHPPRGIAGWVEHLREAIAARCRAALPGARGAIAATLLTGTQTAIPEPDREAFRASGLAHLLAVAGLHIGIVMGLVFAAVRALLALCEYTALHWPTKPVAALAALAAGGGYMLLTGMHVPIERSFAMACLFTLAVVAGRPALSLRGLALAAAVLILLAPQEVPGVSFQMSFSAVLALIAGYEALRPWLHRLRGDGAWWRRAGLHLAALALTSLLAGTASAPYAAYHFGRVQLYFVPANMLAVPLTALWVMPAGLVALALMPLGAQGLALAPMGWGIGAILWVARTTAALPLAVVGVPPMPGWGLAVLSLGIAWLGLWRGRWRLAGIAAIALGAASPVLTRPADLLVAADAHLVAARVGEDMVIARGRGASRFTLDAWRNYWAGATPRPMPWDDTPREAAAPIRCGAAGCLLRPRPGAQAAWLAQGSGGRLARIAARPGQDVPCVAVVVTVLARPSGTVRTEAGGTRRAACPAPLVIDRAMVRRAGAIAVWLGHHRVRLRSDRGTRGDRPWVNPAAPAWPRRRIDLPFAPAGP